MTAVTSGCLVPHLAALVQSTVASWSELEPTISVDLLRS